MKIAICDDESRYIESLTESIYALCPDRSTLCVSSFGSGEELLSDFYRNRFDVVFLDIQMKELDGLKTAKRIREIDSSVILVFLTSYREFAVNGYEYNAFRYLLKDEPAPVLNRNLKAVFAEYHRRNYSLIITENNAVFNVPVCEIMYFEIFKRVVVLHTQEREFEFYGKLSEIEKDERLSAFVKPHKSFFVNLAYIDNITPNGVFLKNGKEINLSRNRRAAVTQRFVTYLTERC